jgi:hypothetical protein
MTDAQWKALLAFVKKVGRTDGWLFVDSPGYPCGAACQFYIFTVMMCVERNLKEVDTFPRCFFNGF